MGMNNGMREHIWTCMRVHIHLNKILIGVGYKVRVCNLHTIPSLEG
jgi:hypothetical protein